MDRPLREPHQVILVTRVGSEVPDCHLLVGPVALGDYKTFVTGSLPMVG